MPSHTATGRHRRLVANDGGERMSYLIGEVVPLSSNGLIEVP